MCECEGPNKQTLKRTVKGSHSTRHLFMQNTSPASPSFCVRDHTGGLIKCSQR